MSKKAVIMVNGIARQVEVKNPLGSHYKALSKRGNAKGKKANRKSRKARINRKRGIRR